MYIMYASMCCGNIYVCMYVYIHIQSMNVYIADFQILERVGCEGRGYTYICMNIYASDACMYVLWKCIHMYVVMCKHLIIYVLTFTHQYIHMYTYKHLIHQYIHMYTYKHINTYICIHINNLN